MDFQNVIQILQSALQPNSERRLDAERAINNLVKTDYSLFLKLLSQVMFDSSVQFQNRQMASLVLKKYFHSKNQRIQKNYEMNWLNLPLAFRTDFIALLHTNLAIKETAILLNISKIYGSIIRIELVNNSTIDIFSELTKDISKPELAVGILETLAFACDQLYEETTYQFDKEKNAIYGIGMCYLDQNTAADKNIIYSSLKCVLSSLEIYEDLLNIEDLKKQFVYRIVMCPKADSEVLEISLDVLNRFVDVYTSITDSELAYVSQAVLSYFETAKDNLPIQIFDFWKILIELGKTTTISYFLPTLVQNLMLCLTNEDFDNSVVTPSKSACSILIELVKKSKFNLISDPSYQCFISNNLTSSEKSKHAIGCLALGCIISPGSEIFVYKMIPLVINCLSSEETVCEALFSLSQICGCDISVTSDFLPNIVKKVGIHVKSSSRIATQAVMVYNSIFSSMQEHTVPEVENIVFYHYPDILSILINRLDQSLPEEYNTRSMINITLSELINTCPPAHKALLDQLEIYLFNKIKATVQHLKKLSINEVLILDDVICSYVILLESSLSLKKNFHLESLFEVFYECLNLPKMLLRGEIYIAISKLLSHFSVHLKKFIPFIIRDLECDEEFVFKSALNLLSDCAFYLEANFNEFTPEVIPALAKAIASSDVPLELKPRVISALGDIALSVGRSFEPYISLCVLLLSQINTLNREGDEEYVDTLKKSVVKLFSCLILSLSTTQEMQKSIHEIFDSLKITIQTDREGFYIKESLELISDSIRCFGSIFKEENWVNHYLNEVIRNSSKENCDKAKQILQLF